MHDAFSKSGPVSSVINRTGKSKKSSKFSPSFGVRRGLIKDPNWPPPQMPEQGTASARRHRRVELSFTIIVRGESLTVSGDISTGGAMFLLPEKLEAKAVDVQVGEASARVEVLSITRRANGYAHHCRFLNPRLAAPVWDAVQGL